MPIRHDGELVGMVDLANRAQGYELHLHNQAELVQFALKHGIAVTVTWVTAVSHAAII